MSFRALLVSKDDQAVEALTPVLSNFGLTVHRCAYPDALCLVSEQKFHAVLVDFDDPHSATLTFENLSAARFRAHAVTVALLADRSKVRNAFGAGANFVLYKPVNAEQAEGTLRADASLDREGLGRAAARAASELSQGAVRNLRGGRVGSGTIAAALTRNR